MKTIKALCVGICLIVVSIFPITRVNAAVWEWQNPLPTGNDLKGVWGASGSDVFAVGNFCEVPQR